MLHRRRFKQSSIFEYRMEEEAINLRKQAEGMPPGIRREELLRKAASPMSKPQRAIKARRENAVSRTNIATEIATGLQ